MLIESLARLSIVNNECIENGIIISSNEFMKETADVIEKQLDILKKDMLFSMNNPGPYVFGLGQRSLIIFPPTYTETSDWAMIVFDEKTQTKEQIFVFQTMNGMIENLINAFKYIENVNNGKDSKKETETGSDKENSSGNIHS
jgi:hypothetical protein